MPAPPPPVHTRWKPGQSGNPGGRPKGSISLTARLRRALNANDGEKADKLIDAMIKGAEKGQHQGTIIKLIFDRIDGAVLSRERVKAAQEAIDGVLDIAERLLPVEYYAVLVQALAEQECAAAAGETEAVE